MMADALGDDAAAGIDEVDERILQLLAEALRATDPVPPSLVHDIGVALTVRGLQAEVAELTRLAADPVATRSESVRVETMTFSVDGLSVMVTLSRTSSTTARVDGWAVGDDPLERVEWHSEGMVQRSEVDEDGRFTLDEVRAGLARFVFVRTPPRPPVVSPTVEI